jgi:hypothetical protein
VRCLGQSEVDYHPAPTSAACVGNKVEIVYESIAAAILDAIVKRQHNVANCALGKSVDLSRTCLQFDLIREDEADALVAMVRVHHAGDDYPHSPYFEAAIVGIAKELLGSVLKPQVTK